MALLFLRAPRGKEFEERPLGIQRMSLKEPKIAYSSNKRKMIDLKFLASNFPHQ
jgi:hypothetical protein